MLPGCGKHQIRIFQGFDQATFTDTTRLEECRERCRSRVPECQFYLYDIPARICYLKFSDRGTQVVHPDPFRFVMAKLDCE